MNTVFRRLMVTAAIAATIAVVTSPAWASFPDQGNRILYGRQKSTSTMAPAARGISQSELFSIRTNGDDRRRVTDTARLAELGGAYSPDGDHIVYAARVADGTGVFRADADGSHRDRLTMNPVSSAPNWSRTGRQIVYVKAPNLTAVRGYAGPIGRRGSPDSDLMVMDADGTGKHSIYFGQVYAPGWSPTDPEIAFTTSAGGPVGVALISPNGGEPELVCCKGQTAVFADWSPDGRRLLVMTLTKAGPSSNTLVFSIRRNGTDATIITDESFSFTLPRYSADGDRVIFAKETGGGTLDLFSVRSDGSGGRNRLTDTPAFDEWLTLLLG